MRFVNDEARSFIARNDERYDVIQISLIDTWAATAAGAFVLSENSLYTVEAWDIFLSHMTPRGLLSVSRWSFSDRPGEVYRMTALATAALQRRGVADPRAHMAIVRSIRGDGGDNAPDGIGTLLVSPSPLDAGDLATLKAQADRLGFQVALDATTATDETLARLASARDLDAVVAAHPINIAPPTDDSPFFFNMLRLRDVLRLDLLKHGKSSHNMEAVFVLGTLLFTVLLLTALCIVVPLFVTSDRKALAGAAPLVTFFAAIGLGFMLVETSQMQRLIVVLGHPTYGLTVVLFSLLLSSGIGSALTSRIAPGRGRAGGCGPPGRAPGPPGRLRRHHADADAPDRRRGDAGPHRRLGRAPGGPGAVHGDGVPPGPRPGPEPAGADALALGRQRRHVGVRIGARGGHRPQHHHLDRVLGRLLLLPRRPGGVRPAGKARAGSSRRSGHGRGASSSKLEATPRRLVGRLATRA